ncbi:hypothetical protein EIB71_01620 [Kaistella daneshvariae]|uniref:DUF4134 domain-containing protein n=1 Tax=Kaistella daneshvariae TaxID=2487074 RepID=A0ABN5SW45_9FLAO|nr:hypothetical protein [Kaistella daneshvariae]AZI66454.1 hypothetical protein EIB71_01620 [Kaistella daneshvariae]
MKTILLILVITISQFSFAQQQNISHDTNTYLKKSLKQKRTANILAITGGALFLSGAIITGSDQNDFLISQQQFLGLAISGAGIISGLISVPFYVAASKNKSISRRMSPAAGSFKTNGEHYFTAGIKIDF